MKTKQIHEKNLNQGKWLAIPIFFAQFSSFEDLYHFLTFHTRFLFEWVTGPYAGS